MKIFKKANLLDYIPDPDQPIWEPMFEGLKKKDPGNQQQSVYDNLPAYYMGDRVKYKKDPSDPNIYEGIIQSNMDNEGKYKIQDTNDKTEHFVPVKLISPIK